jgi:hypothetical protein
MKITVEQLRTMVTTAINEAKKKKAKVAEAETRADGQIVDKNLDFAPPLGAFNLYRSQGAANFGPYTNTAPTIDDRVYGTKMESALRQVIGQMISEELRPDPRSAWAFLTPAPAAPVPSNIWEAAMHYYDFQRRGLGSMKEDAKPLPPNTAVAEKKVGFKKLKGKLSHEKGVKDAGALAASIGRNKYGAKGMAKKAAAGRK